MDLFELLISPCVQNSIAVQGTKKLINDLSSALVVLGPTLSAVACVYFLIRKSMADEQDQKIWKNRIWIAIGAAIGVVTVGGMLPVILSYFQ